MPHIKEIRKAKAKPSAVPPVHGERQEGPESICEECLHFNGVLFWNGQKWICQECWGKQGYLKI